MISIPNLVTSGIYPVGTSPAAVYMTDFSLDVKRDFLGETYSYSNTYNFSLDGVIFDAAFSDGKLSSDINNALSAIADNTKLQYRVKSFNVESDGSNFTDGIRSSKFKLTAEFKEAAPDYNKYKELDANFVNIMPEFIENSGEHIKSLSENFSIEQQANGEGKFTQSFDLTLMPISGQGTQADHIKNLIDNRYLRNAANAFIAGLDAKHSSFLTATALIFSNMTGFNYRPDLFQPNFTGNAIVSETADLLNNSYSITRTSNYFTGIVADYTYDRSYDLSVNGEGIVEISEETKLKGNGTITYLGLLNKLYTEAALEGSAGNVTNDSNTYNNIKNSYVRCNTFLNTYKNALRLKLADATSATYLSHYGLSNSLYSLKPIVMEKNLTALPQMPSLVYKVKYTTNPNINFGYESLEQVKANKKGAIFDVTHSFDIKVFSPKTGDFTAFNAGLGSKQSVTNFASFVNDATNGALKRSTVFVHELINGSQSVNLKNLRPGGVAVPLALIKKSSSMPRRGKNFSLNLSYSSDNKYAPLYYLQNPSSVTTFAPAQGTMFNNLSVPVPVQAYIANNFTSIDRKVKITLPIEKFTQKIVLPRPQGVSIIEPSFFSSTGKISMSFKMKIKRNNIDFFPNNTLALNPYIDKVRLLISELFASPGRFSAIFHAAVNAELGTLLGSGLHNVNSYAPISITYKFDSDFNLEISTEIEFYSKSQNSTQKPIFGFRAYF